MSDIKNCTFVGEQGSINVKDYGAIGDRTTDDRRSVQRAVNVAALAGRAAVYFPLGEYGISGPVRLSGSWWVRLWLWLKSFRLPSKVK